MMSFKINTKMFQGLIIILLYKRISQLNDRYSKTDGNHNQTFKNNLTSNIYIHVPLSHSSTERRKKAHQAGSRKTYPNPDRSSGQVEQFVENFETYEGKVFI